jgi:hypothetical protein
VGTCRGQANLALRKQCLQRLALGVGLTAQNALYELGWLARDAERKPDEALAHWRQYLLRHPDGALASEAALGIFELHLSGQRTAEATEAAAFFEERFSDDPRAPEVALARAELLCAQQQRRRAGRAALAALAMWAPVELQEAIVEARMLCGPPGEGETAAPGESGETPGPWPYPGRALTQP